MASWRSPARERAARLARRKGQQRGKRARGQHAHAPPHAAAEASDPDEASLLSDAGPSDAEASYALLSPMAMATASGARPYTAETPRRTPLPLHASPLKRNRKSSQSQVEVEVVDEETLLDSALEVVFG